MLGSHIQNFGKVTLKIFPFIKKNCPIEQEFHKVVSKYANTYKIFA